MNQQAAIQQQLANTITFFTEKKAISADSAIPMTPLDWAKLGHMADPTKLSFLSIYSKFIKKTSDDRYYLDENSLNQSFADQSNAINAIFVWAAIGIGALVLVGIIGLLTGEL